MQQAGVQPRAPTTHEQQRHVRSHTPHRLMGTTDWDGTTTIVSRHDARAHANAGRRWPWYVGTNR
eukprot:12450794-Prorocentrum_lima.AAC.1